MAITKSPNAGRGSRQSRTENTILTIYSPQNDMLTAEEENDEPG
jgi:hypothetical protein